MTEMSQARPPSPRPRGRASNSSETRQLIVDAAARLFSERGYATASLSDIASAAGVTKGALYWHFKSKEDIALEIVRQMYASWPALLSQVMAEHDDALNSLIAVTYSAASQFTNEYTVQAAKRLLAELPAESLSQLPTPYVGWQQALTGLVRDGQQVGQINAAVDAEAVAQVVVASFFGMQQVSYELTNRKDLVVRIDAFWQLVRPQLAPD